MDEFQLLSLLHSNPSIRLQVFDSVSSTRKGDLAVKQYLCTRGEEADSLLRAAMAQAREPYPVWAALVEVRLAAVAESAHFTVNFIYEKFEKEFYRGLMSANDRGRSEGLSNYEIRKRIYERDGDIPIRVNEGWARRQGCEVVIKTYEPIYSADRANLMVKEAFVQASVAHENNCGLVDVAVCECGQRSFALHLIMEKLSKDLSVEISERSSANRPFSEQELLSFLVAVTSGLIHAKSKVTLTQRIAHRDIKPANLFLSLDRLFKVGDFGSAWEKSKIVVSPAPFDPESHQSLQSVTASAGGTVPYLSPEMRRSLLGEEVAVDPFASDVYSLGVTLLHMAKLEYPNSVNTSEEARVKESVRLEIAGVQCSQDVKELLAGMLRVEGGSRPIVEAVKAQAVSLMGSPQHVYGERWDRMTPEQLVLAESEIKGHILRLENSAEDQSETLAQWYFMAASLYETRSEFLHAEKYALKCLKLRTSLFGDTHLATAAVYESLSAICLALGRNDEAETFSLKDLHVKSQLAGNDSLDVAKPSFTLANIYSNLSRHEEAELFAKRAKALRKRHLGKCSHETAMSCSQIAILHQARGKFLKAEKAALKSISIYEQLQSSGDSGEPLLTLSTVSAYLGKYLRPRSSH